MSMTPFPGHDPALPTVTRRTLLRASPAFCVGLLPAQAAADADTPILRLFREWDALQAYWNGAPEDEEDALLAEDTRLESAIEAEPVTCLADLTAKIVVSSCYGDFALAKAIATECEAILAGGAA